MARAGTGFSHLQRCHRTFRRLKFTSNMSRMDDDEDSVLDLADQLNRPPDVAIQQQRVKAWHPILDPEWMIYGYLILAVILIPLGT